MKRIIAQARKEMKHFRRDRLTMALSVLMPVVMIWIFGVTIALNPDRVTLLVEDHDRTPVSRAYIDGFAAGEEFVIVRNGVGTRPEEALDEGVASAVLVIPPGFERRILSGTGGEVQFLLDGSDANTALILKQEAQAIHQTFLATRAGAAHRPIDAAIRFWYNPGLSDRIYAGTGALAMVLIFFPALLGATATSREHELGNVIQVYASSLSVNEWTLGKALPHVMIGLFEFVLCFAVGSIWFSYKIPSDPVPMVTGTFFYITIGVLFGMWVGNQTKSQSASIQIVQFGVFLVSMLLSGFLTPVASIPVQLRWISRLIPATYYVDLVRDSLLRNAGWATSWLPVLVLGGLMMAVYGMIVLQMRRMRYED